MVLCKVMRNIKFEWSLAKHSLLGTSSSEIFGSLRPHGKNGFVTATKLGTTKFLLLQPKILLQQPNFLLVELNILLL